MQSKHFQATITEVEGLWDKRKVARFFGVSVATVDQWVSKKRGPRHRKVGALVRFHPDDIRAYFSSCPAGGGGDIAA